jgi:hypothetical protein
VHVVNGFPLPAAFFTDLARRYRRILTIEDGLIGNPASGVRGFAGLAATHLGGSGVRLDHFGICDPQVAPSEHFVQVWEHFGLTEEALVSALL